MDKVYGFRITEDDSLFDYMYSQVEDMSDDEELEQELQNYFGNSFHGANLSIEGIRFKFLADSSNDSMWRCLLELSGVSDESMLREYFDRFDMIDLSNYEDHEL